MDPELVARVATGDPDTLMEAWAQERAANERWRQERDAWAAKPDGQRAIAERRGKIRRQQANRRYVEKMLHWTPPLAEPQHPIACERSARRPREQRPSTRRSASRAKASSDPPQDDDEPPTRRPLASPGEVEGSGETDLNVVWRDALDRFETAEEYRVLAQLAAVRARWMRSAA